MSTGFVDDLVNRRRKLRTNLVMNDFDMRMVNKIVSPV
jgi:hypothetical protein